MLWGPYFNTTIACGQGSEADGAGRPGSNVCHSLQIVMFTLHIDD